MATPSAAFDLAANYGLPVFACLPDKRPATQHGFLDATTDLDELERQFVGEKLVGIRTGKESRLLVIDIDPKGHDWYREHFERLKCGFTQHTRREGFHLYYWYPASVEIRNSASQLAPGVDVRGEGGYVIAWGAEGLPASGSWDDIGDAPEWLIEALTRQHDKTARPNGKGAIGEGQRNDSLFRLGCKLRRAGLDADEIAAALKARNAAHCQPPLSEHEVRAIATSAARYEALSDTGLPRRPMAWPGLIGRDPPRRDWVVDHWAPAGVGSLLAGRGGIGKTLLSQALGTCIALGLDYFAPIAKPRRVLIWAGEDDHDELWRRQLDICAWLGKDFADLEGNLIVQAYSGEDITLAAQVYGALAPTPTLKMLAEQIGDYRADYVFLDSIARIYGGNENDRHQVTTFMAWLTQACSGAGFCLLGHPSKAPNSEFSGNTAWEASARARLYLGDKLPDAEPDESEPADDTVRYLARRKANYAPTDWCRLEYRNGVFLPTAMPADRPATVGGEFVNDIVLRAVRRLAERDIHCTPSTSSPSYLPKLARQFDLLDRATPKQFAAAMRKLILDGRLKSAVVGQYQNRTPKQGLVLP